MIGAVVPCFVFRVREGRRDCRGGRRVRVVGEGEDKIHLRDRVGKGGGCETGEGFEMIEGAAKLSDRRKFVIQFHRFAFQCHSFFPDPPLQVSQLVVHHFPSFAGAASYPLIKSVSLLLADGKPSNVIVKHEREGKMKERHRRGCGEDDRPRSGVLRAVVAKNR